MPIPVSKETHDKLRRAQDLLRREIRDGDPGAIFDRALTLLLREVEKKKMAATSRPRRPRGTKEGSRDIPAHVRRAVWRRDDDRCAFVGTKGRCTERAFLELHHVTPFGHQGPATVENISLRCAPTTPTRPRRSSAVTTRPPCASRAKNTLFPGKSHPFRNGGPK